MRLPKLSFSVSLSRYWVAFAALTLLFAVIWFRNAWMSDDAYITLRTVYNTLHGLGPTFNPGDRVQNFTHPLWFLLLLPSFALSGEPYYSTLAVSLVVSLVVIFLFARYLARTPQQAIFGIAVMILSKAYIDYSSAGLENPLSQLCIALFLVFFFQTNYSVRRVFSAALCAALGTLTRFDLILFFLPPLMYCIAQTWQSHPNQRGRVIGAIAAGFVPFFLWCGFALFYYGFLLPNTYYAKTPANMALAVWLNQGVKYFLNSLSLDPITLPLIALAILLAFSSRTYSLISIALGICLYLLYVLRIGGDFMSGRFFNVPLFAAIVILARVAPLANLKIMPPLTTLLLVAALFSRPPTLLSNETYGATNDPARIALVGPDRIADYRAYFYHWTGLLRNLRDTSNLMNIPEVQDGLKAASRKGLVMRTTGLGLRSYYAGPQKYVVDEMALGDPFLAWMPRKDGWWIIGHFPRCAPIGYARTLHAKAAEPNHPSMQPNLIQDRDLANLYAQMGLLARANLLDPNRIAPIIKFNLGGYDFLRTKSYSCENFYSGKPDSAITIAH